MQDIHKRILLAPSSLHSAIQKELLDSKQGLLGIRLMTMESFLLSQVPHPRQFDDVLFQYLPIMRNLQQSLYVFKNICLDSGFLEECKSILEDLKLFSIPLSSLPQDTEQEKELAVILRNLYDVPLRSQFLEEALRTPIQQQEVLLYPAILDVRQQFMADILRQHGAKSYETVEDQPEISFYHAMNMREETESLAQFVITHKLSAEECSITVCNPQYKHLLNQILHRYQIPHTIVSQSAPSSSAKYCRAFLQYYLNPNHTKLLKLLDYDVFPSIDTKALLEYMELFQKELQDSFDPILMVQSELISDYDLERLQKLQEKAESAKQQLLEYLNPLRNANLKDALIYICKMIAAVLHPQKQRQEYLQLQKYLQHCLPHLHTKQDLEALCAQLKKLSSSGKDSEIKGILIHDLTTLMPQRPHRFLLGTTQADYPAFPLKKGIFDETYYAKLPYPTLQERYDKHNLQITRQLQQGKTLWVSYPLGNYEGKGKEAALEIETYVQKKPVPYPIRYHLQTIEKPISITPSQAKQLYLKNGTLYGSISSLERYVKCPFSYFLRYGLYVKEPLKSGFDESKAGTLAHHVLESLTKHYGKQYVDIQKEKVEAILEDQFSAILRVYPNRQDWADLIQQRLLLNIMQNLMVLKEMEQHSEMSIYQSEYEFYKDYDVDGTQLRLHGFIDRIDEKNEFLRIIDYKSSPKSLCEQDVFAALQLQLITYGIVAQETFRKKLLGTYYISLKNENIPYLAGKMKRRPVEYIQYQDADYKDSIFTAHRMQGWNMDEHLEIIDDNGTHIIGITMNKNGDVKARKLYDLDTIQQHAKTMYRSIGRDLLRGRIAIAPNEQACQYCAYHEICRFRGFPEKKELLVELDETLYK